MKKLLFLLFLISSYSFAQNHSYDMVALNAYVMTKEGQKIMIKDGDITIHKLESRIAYQSADGKNKSVKYKELDYLTSDNFLIESVKLNNEKREDIYFVLAQTADKKMLSNTGRYSFTILYKGFVVDNNDNVIAELNAAGGSYVPKKAIPKSGIASFVKKYFPDCQQLLEKSTDFKEKEEGHAFFDKPIFIKCN